MDKQTRFFLLFIYFILGILSVLTIALSLHIIMGY